MEVKRFYDDLAKDYDDLRYGQEYYRQIAQLELNFVQKYITHGSCLEVGAGTGRVTELLLSIATDVLAIDISPQMTEQLKKKFPNSKKLTIKVHDIYELHKIEGYGKFESAICLRVLSHLEEPIAALKKLFGAVEKEGIVIIDFWNSWGYQALAKRLKLKHSAVYTRYMTIDKMREIISESGLHIIDKCGFGFPPFKIFLSIEKRYLSWLDFLKQRILWVCKRTETQK